MQGGIKMFHLTLMTPTTTHLFSLQSSPTHPSITGCPLVNSSIAPSHLWSNFVALMAEIHTVCSGHLWPIGSGEYHAVWHWLIVTKWECRRQEEEEF